MSPVNGVDTALARDGKAVQQGGGESGSPVALVRRWSEQGKSASTGASNRSLMRSRSAAVVARRSTLMRASATFSKRVAQPLPEASPLTVLHSAAFRGDTERIKQVIESLGEEASNLLDTPGSDGVGAACVAARMGWGKALQALLDGGASTTLQQGHLKVTPLHCAAVAGNKDCVRVLLGSGVSPDVKDGSGKRQILVRLWFTDSCEL